MKTESVALSLLAMVVMAGAQGPLPGQGLPPPPPVAGGMDPMMMVMMMMMDKDGDSSMSKMLPLMMMMGQGGGGKFMNKCAFINLFTLSFI